MPTQLKCKLNLTIQGTGKTIQFKGGVCQNKQYNSSVSRSGI